eukprot:Rmarinus@m.21097
MDRAIPFVHQALEQYPNLTHIGIKIAIGVPLFLVARYAIVAALLRYTRWVSDPKSITTKLWGVTLKTVSALYPLKFGAYHFQWALPRLPVPSLSSTLDMFLDTVKPLLSEEEYRETVEAARKFPQTGGRKLQLYLWLRSLVTKNWSSEFWLKYLYLISRKPLPVFSNTYAPDALSMPLSKTLGERMAYLIHLTLRFRSNIQNKMPPMRIQGFIPIDMNGYERMFGVVRVPGEEMDAIEEYPDSRHLAVIIRDNIYTFDVLDSRGNPIQYRDIRTQFERILRDAPQGKFPIAAGTGLPRSEWFALREALQAKSQRNRQSLRLIESALAVVTILDRDSEVGTGENLETFHRLSFYGDGHSHWFDKNQLVFFRDQHSSFHFEHAPTDGTVHGHLWEYVLMNEPNLEVQVPRQVFEYPPYEENTALPPANRLEWDVSEDMADEFRRAAGTVQALGDRLDLKVMRFMDFGKDVIKGFRMSPDGFVQMALQLAYYRNRGHTPLTYESASTRIFLEGRTETIRSASTASATFVQSMEDPSYSPSERRTLLRDAVGHHYSYTRRATRGLGIDRHLMGLYIIAKGMGMDDNPFFKSPGFNLQFKLSTSQVPPRQYPELGKSPDTDTLGFGFGPSCEDGYGVAYTMANTCMCITATSWRSCGETDTQAFLEELRRALWDLHALLKSK